MFKLNLLSSVLVFCAFSGCVSAEVQFPVVPDSVLGIVWDRSGALPTGSTPHLVPAPDSVKNWGKSWNNYSTDSKLIAELEKGDFSKTSLDANFKSEAATFWELSNNFADRYYNRLHPSPAKSDEGIVISSTDPGFKVPTSGIGSGGGESPEGIPKLSGSYKPSDVRYKLGDVGPGGGIVFLVSPDGKSGMEARWNNNPWPAMTTFQDWGCNGKPLSSGFADRIGTGSINSLFLADKPCMERIHGSDDFVGAILFSQSEVYNHFDDWYIPSASEARVLAELVVAYKVHGKDRRFYDFKGYFWTSTQYIPSLPLRNSKFAVSIYIPESARGSLSNPLNYVRRDSNLQLVFVRKL